MDEATIHSCIGEFIPTIVSYDPPKQKVGYSTQSCPFCGGGHLNYTPNDGRIHLANSKGDIATLEWLLFCPMCEITWYWRLKRKPTDVREGYGICLNYP